MSSGTIIGSRSAPSSRAGAAPWIPPLSLEDVQGRFIANLFSIELAIAVLTQKIALPLGASGGRNQIAFALVLHYIVLGILAWKGLLRVDPTRLLLFCFFGGVSFAFHSRADNDDFSITSIILVLFILAFYIFIVPIKRKYYIIVVRNFIWIACAAACLTWLDWATQLTGLGKTNLDAVIPDLFRYRQYNYWNRMWGGPLHIKPNATFFLEMSHLSQFMATGLIFEILFFRRLPVMMFLGISIIGSFGGTGIVLLLLCIPFLLHRLPLVTLLAGLLALPIVALVATQTGYIETALSRTAEFDKDKASANTRFVKPLEAVVEAVTGPVDEFIMGKGAGTMTKTKMDALNRTIEGGITWAPYAKVLGEYGVVALVFWFALISVSMFRPGIPIAASMALLVQYHLLNGSLAVPLHSVYSFILISCYVFIDDQESSPLKQVSNMPATAGAEA